MQIYNLLLLIIICGSCQTTVSENKKNSIRWHQEKHPRLVRMESKFNEGVQRIYNTDFFYNETGLLDSIANYYSSCYKIKYDADGEIRQVIDYSLYHKPILYTYSYSGDTVVINYEKMSIPHIRNSEGAILHSNHPMRNDDVYYKFDKENQVIDERKYYFSNNKEHFHEVFSYTSVLNPLYFAGMCRIFTGHRNKYMINYEHIIHSDCGDYYAGKFRHKVVSNDYGFPISESYPGAEIKFYYE